MDSVTQTSFTLPKWDAKKKSSTFIGLILLAAVGLVVYSYVLPWLLGIVWGTIELVVGGCILAFILAIVTNKKFWRGMHYLTEGIARYSLGLVIELNPFEILLEQVEAGEKNREDLKKQGDKLRAQQQSLAMQVDDNDKIMHQSAGEIKVAQQILTKDPENFQTQLDLQTSTTNFTNAKDFIDQVKPLLTQISKMADFTDKAYRKSGVELQNARSTIKIKKAQFDAVTTGSAAMASAMKAFFGDGALNQDADQALDALRMDVARKLGTIKSAIDVTSGVMSHNDLRDAAKMNVALDAVDKFDLDSFSYSNAIGDGAPGAAMKAIPMNVDISNNNRYDSFLKTKK